MKRLLSDAYESAKAILGEHRDQLERVAQELLKRETLDEQTFKTLLEPPASEIAPASSVDIAAAGNGKAEVGPFLNSEKETRFLVVDIRHSKE